jgi:hypothetical protein
MKSYHSIPHWNKGPFGVKTIAQEKKDGSSMRFEWSKKSGFYKFGTRNVMIDRNDKNFGEGIDLFLNKYSEDLQRVFLNKYSKVISFVAFAEFFGPNSFAGQHLSSDIKDVCLFDISLYKKGIINPYEFQDNFGHLDTPRIIYEGEYNMEFINDVRNNNYNLSEGVVCKGIIKTKKEGESIFMVKAKTNEWLRKVKYKLGEKALLDELNGDKDLLINLVNK